MCVRSLSLELHALANACHGYLYFPAQWYIVKEPVSQSHRISLFVSGVCKSQACTSSSRNAADVHALFTYLALCKSARSSHTRICIGAAVWKLFVLNFCSRAPAKWYYLLDLQFSAHRRMPFATHLHIIFPNNGICTSNGALVCTRFEWKPMITNSEHKIRIGR